MSRSQGSGLCVLGFVLRTTISLHSYPVHHCPAVNACAVLYVISGDRETPSFYDGLLAVVAHRVLAFYTRYVSGVDIPESFLQPISRLEEGIRRVRWLSVTYTWDRTRLHAMYHPAHFVTMNCAICVSSSSPSLYFGIMRVVILSR
jgi:hypothetical protein